MIQPSDVMPETILTPDGKVVLGATACGDAVPDDFAKLRQSFASSTAHGLTFLVSQKCVAHLSPSLVFWQQFARTYFRALCRQGIPGSRSLSAGRWNRPDPPDDQSLDETLSAAPPMMGLEYLSAPTLSHIWNELDALTEQKSAARKGGLPSYLRSLHSDWNLVGRVTFHLAENKKNPDRPFAFMATFTPVHSQASTSPSGVKHVPLSEALRQSIENKNRKQLDALLEPVSRAAKSTPLIAELLQSGALFAPQAWEISQAYQFLSVVPGLEESGIIVRVPNWWNASRPPRPSVEVRVGSRPQSTLREGGLDLQINVSIDGEPLSRDELAELSRARQELTFLRGRWVQVDHDQLRSALDQWTALQREHVGGLGFLEGMRMLAGASIGAVDVSDEARQWTRIVPGDWLREKMDELRDPGGKIAIDAEQNLNATLRPYQSDGARWLWLANQLGLGVCLADDMGLGKTIQVITLLLQLKLPPRGVAGKKTKRQPAKPPTLLILPTSLLGNWQREIENFAPSLKLKVLHRSRMDAKQINEIAADPATELAGVDVVATTYGLARREKWLADFRWRLVVLDEAQAIKNSGAAQTKAIKSIPSDGRIALTGTPVENHLGDLWSLFDFCSPGLLGTATEFKKFVKADDANVLSQRLASLRQLIRPYVLRRMKSDPRIISDLPEKTEMRVDCGLTQTQATLYRTIIDELERSLDVAAGIQRRGMVLAALMQLKQICNHPSLYLKHGDFAAKQSGKFAELRSISETLIEKQEKMLVFTQFQSMCDPLSKFLETVFARPGLVLTGKTPAKKRAKLVENFQRADGPPTFVISVKAGGTGLNLTQASHVVHFDRWWNPAVEDQATDRAFRIGQKRNVIVHKFVCRGTLEERIDDLIRSKKAVSEQLFSQDRETQLTEMSNDQLLKFISLDLAKASTS